VNAEELRRRLLDLEPPILARVTEDRCLLDLRSILPQELPLLARGLQELDRRLAASPEATEAR
jgi:hypothetical protein